ncbi:geranylgeranyl transferase type-2 subunit alpha 1 [Dioscorea cayenensis subsp. rotundata]|uniref:Geranylgeranyl transferase type-2 subunit alpha n=1 Tax=Dioscorea cayennensis subsp. rotundata TaxID=55577 RepID=A0AB40BJ61_DIOCR|nr:geranylgeranyl transferase type-2 subunit alpha 1 [Dioscorea cayenensis subsp. rotundata]
MHGRPRNAPRSEDSAEKAGKLRDLQAQLLHNHHNRIYTNEARAASARLLEINPEIYTAWNYRKLALQSNLKEVTDVEAIKAFVEEELRVVEAALRQNPKSYGAWYHRKWVLSYKFSPANFDHEYWLLGRLMKLDPRNFHGWNYRRFLASLSNVPEVEELKYTMEMIDSNFSNYSAWHNRSFLLSNLLKEKAQGFVSKEKILTDEYDLVHQALFTEASDQSGWFYFLWLLDQTVSPDQPLVVSSWPAHGSSWVVSTNRSNNDCRLFPSEGSNSCYYLPMSTVPIILYFNQPVSGVSSSTVTVNSVYTSNEDITWRPLALAKSGSAHCWVTYLKISDARSNGTSSVEISLGHSQDIKSARGLPYTCPVLLKFTIELNCIDAEQPGGEFGEELFVFNSDQVCLPYEGFPISSFDQLKISENCVPVASSWDLETLSNEISLFKGSPDDNCKFVKLTLARLLVAYDAMMSERSPSLQKKTHSEEVLKFFDDLIRLDPVHAKFYEDQRSLVILDQVTFDKESLMKNYGRLCKLASSNHHYHVLQLNKLSLTRIGFVERLLWVQILDLSHNEIQSISGLEALQLLTCLNLANNQLNSFAALEPLRLLSSLRVLDVSFNKIGSHLIDTKRYLCSSPMSHTVDIKEFQDTEIADYWEVIFIFKDLQLTQLNIDGNAVANDNLSLLLKKTLPGLIWLNGDRVQ